MPVTARFSKLFYERLGDEIVNELVEWFNQVDATYRSDLRELNEHNYTRFEAHLERRFAELDAKIDRVAAELKAELRTEFNSGLAELKTEFSSGINGLRSDLKIEFNSRLDGLETVLERGLKEQTRWMFVAWTALLIPLIALWFR